MAPAQSFCRQIFLLLGFSVETMPYFFQPPAEKDTTKRVCIFQGRHQVPRSMRSVTSFTEAEDSYMASQASFPACNDHIPPTGELLLRRSIMIHLRLCHRHASHTVCRHVPVLGGSLVRKRKHSFSMPPLRSPGAQARGLSVRTRRGVPQCPIIQLSMNRRGLLIPS